MPTCLSVCISAYLLLCIFYEHFHLSNIIIIIVKKQRGREKQTDRLKRDRHRLKRDRHRQKRDRHRLKRNRHKQMTDKK